MKILKEIFNFFVAWGEVIYDYKNSKSSKYY